MISEETVDRVISSTDIVDLVQSYFPLRKIGTDYTALCPFHNEKTPSFTVSPSKQMFYCFGCGAGGGAARFLMERESIDFPAAIRRLAERQGIPIIEDQVSPEEALKRKQRSVLLEIHHEAAVWFHLNLLKKPVAEGARAYLKQRGLGIEVARDWQLGFAPEDPRLFFEWARSKGYDTRVLLDAGLAAEREGPTGRPRIAARFRNRLMFPVCNDFGEVIAFSGRTLDPEANVAKYLNSPETALFHKSKTLFGLHRSKRPILKEGRAIICEGQIDLITASSQGIDAMVAPLGTAFTDEHARLLKRLTGEVVVCFDADTAGYKAAQRTFKALAPADIFVKAVEMPEGEDPDSYIRQFGAEAFRELVEQAPEFLDYQISQRARSGDLHAARTQHELAGELAENIALVRDKLMQDTMINAVSGRLGLSHEELRRRVFSAQRQQKRQNERQSKWKDAREESASQRRPVEIEVLRDPSSRLLCQMILIDREAKIWLGEQIENYGDLSSIPDGDILRRLATAEFDPQDSKAVSHYLVSKESDLESLLVRLTMKPPEGNHLQGAQDAWARLTRAVTQRRYREVEAELKKAGLEPSRMIELLGELKGLKEKLDR